MSHRGVLEECVLGSGNKAGEGLTGEASGGGGGLRRISREAE